MTKFLITIIAAIVSVTACWAADPSPHAINTQAKGDDPPAAADLVRGMTLPDGFRVVAFAAEPDVSQPIAITTDARGRLWVVENYSYPEWRTTGTDRVVIFEDADGDGRFDSRKVFLDGGRNLTGIALGHGGVWLTSPPELVFVPDRNRDDVPDGPAEPILDGFNAKTIGHNVVNGLLWGPDGWLYGRHGITATSRVGRPGDPDSTRTTIDCSIWRVHPQTRRFEVVARGTTNPWGLDYDDYGEMIFTNNVIGHLWHLIPGAHYERMRGVDPEPHVYELMPQCADHLHWAGGEWKDAREQSGKLAPALDALGGGHSHCGGMIYLGEMFPESYRGKIFMCNTHGKRVNVDRLEHGPRGIVGRHDPDFLKAFDTWFRGIELVSGPDGRVWIADWTDKGECHDHDGVHRTSGRIYTVLYGSPRRTEPIDLHAQSDGELVALQLNRNDWFCRRAREILAERAAAGRDLDSAAAVELRRLAETHADPTRRLRGLWAAHAIGAADRAWLRARLADGHEAVRAWAVRLLVDDPTGDAVATAAPDWLGDALAQLAKHEPAGIVRLHLAGALGKLPHRFRWPIAESLADRASDADWRELSLLVWYGLRGPVAEDPSRAAALAAKTPMPTLRRLIARRLAFDADRSAAFAGALESLLGVTRGDPGRRADVTAGIAAAWEGRKKLPLPATLLAAVAADPALARFAKPRPEPELKPQDDAAAATAAEIARLQAAGPSTPAARAAAIRDWRQKLTPDELSRADRAQGRAVWRQRCGVCHVLFDEGGNLGPNLTGSGRAEGDYVILNVMDPSAVVPEAWRLTQVITADGRMLSGAVAAADDRTLTLRTTSGDVVLDREEIEEVITREQSVMPEGLFNGLADEEVRDLVAYLAAPTQVPLPAAETVAEPFPGLRYVHRHLSAPREIDMHIAIIDLNQPGVTIKTTGANAARPGECDLETTKAFVKRSGAQIGINSGFFSRSGEERQLGVADLSSLAVADGEQVSDWGTWIKDAVNIGADNTVTFVTRAEDDSTGFMTTPKVDLYNALSGNARLIRDGVVLPGEGGDTTYPQAAIGHTADHRLILFVSDGRQPEFSAGMTYGEVAVVLKEFGAVDAIALDGGGSATMVMAAAGKDRDPRVLNRPSDGQERAVGNNLAVIVSVAGRAAAPPDSQNFRPQR
ncbi:MAG: PVC-type heme-binding CxxCH protein [Planctomycetota bacterium]